MELQDIDRLIDVALREDIGQGDITSDAVIPEDATVSMACVAREKLVVCGLPVVLRLLEKAGLKADVRQEEGDFIEAGAEIMRIQGNARALLSVERVLLNIMQHMSGIATLTRAYTEAVKGTGADIFDTRKTLPGLRSPAKYAVRTGGGVNHRMRLDDGILIKDNHIHICGGVKEAVSRAKARAPKDIPIEVECDTLEQVEEALQAGADIILLDNMMPQLLRKAVALVGGKAILEASGGITFETIRAVAETGVDRISIGALTHSVRAVDIGLDEVA